MDLFRLILHFRPKPTESLYYSSNIETIYFEYFHRGVSARSRSPQEGMWVDFKYQAAGQKQELSGAAAQVMHLNRTAATAPYPAVF